MQAVNTEPKVLRLDPHPYPHPTFLLLTEWPVKGRCKRQPSFDYLIVKAKGYYQLLTFSIDFFKAPFS